MKRPEPTAVGESQRVTKPVRPPESDAEPLIPSDDVATHLVDVPVVWSTIPRVPDAFVESRNAPERLRLVAASVVEKKFDEVALVNNDEDAYKKEDVPTLIFPERSTEKIDAPDEDEIESGVTPGCAEIVSIDDGDVEPIPTIPVFVIVILSFPCPSARSKIEKREPFV
jgi:hypothetical protein